MVGIKGQKLWIILFQIIAIGVLLSFLAAVGLSTPIIKFEISTEITNVVRVIVGAMNMVIVASGVFIASRSLKNTAQIARSTLLNTKDELFESDFFRRRRDTLWDRENQIRQYLKEKSITEGTFMNDEAIEIATVELLSEWFMGMKNATQKPDLPFTEDESTHLYKSCISLLDFWESIGFLAERNSISMDECIDLYGALVRQTIPMFVPYISHRMEKNPRSYSGAYWLYEQACDDGNAYAIDIKTLVPPESKLLDEAHRVSIGLRPTYTPPGAQS